MFQSLTKKLSN